MSFHSENFISLGVEQEQKDDAAEPDPDKLFKQFLQKCSLTRTDRMQRESILLSMPIHLKEANHKNIDNVVLFPFGTFYHGIGFKGSPLTAFVARGEPAGKGECHVDGNDDNSSTGSVHSSDSDGEKSPKSSMEDSCRMRQSLLLEINDVLTSPQNQVKGTYNNVSLTRHGKLSFIYHQHNSVGLDGIGGTAKIHCSLEARSFLPVQRSRLIKFYCILEPLFWSFSQLVIHWAGSTGIVDRTEKIEMDELKQEQLLLLLIFFLVRRQIIPSFKILKEWAMIQLIVDDINVAFCENVDIVRKNCKMMGIGTGPEAWTLERILQLVYDFLNEMTTFDFCHYGVAPSTGTSFSKVDAGNFVLYPNNARRLNVNSMVCIQDVLDPCENVAKKVTPYWGVKFKLRCKDVAEKLFPLLWSGDLPNAVLLLIETNESDNEEFDQRIATYINSAFNLTDSLNFKPIFTPEPLRRYIRFKIPSKFLQLLNHCHDFVEGLGSFGTSIQTFKVAVMTLFYQFLKEFNILFWRKLAAAHLIQNNDDPVRVDFVENVDCSFSFSKEEKAVSVVKAVMEFFTSTVGADCSNGVTTFYVVADWTKERRDDILKSPVEKSIASDVVKSLINGMNDPRIVYGKRNDPPKPSQKLAAVELSASFDVDDLVLVTVVGCNESLQLEDISPLRHILSWYNAFVKSFVCKKFNKWIGAHVVTNLEEIERRPLISPPESGNTILTKMNPWTMAMTQGGTPDHAYHVSQFNCIGTNTVVPNRIVDLSSTYLLPGHFTHPPLQVFNPGMPTRRDTPIPMNTNCVGRGSRGFGSRGRPILMNMRQHGRGKRGGRARATYHKPPY